MTGESMTNDERKALDKRRVIQAMHHTIHCLAGPFANIPSVVLDKAYADVATITERLRKDVISDVEAIMLANDALEAAGHDLLLLGPNSYFEIMSHFWASEGTDD